MLISVIHFKILVVFVSKYIYFYDSVIIFHWYITTENLYPHKAKPPIRHVKTKCITMENMFSCGQGQGPYWNALEKLTLPYKIDKVGYRDLV